MKNWLRWVAWACLAAVAGMTTWLFLANGPHPPAPTAAAREAPDYRLYDARITQFSAAGGRRYVLEANTVAHMPASGETQLSTVDLDYFPGPGPEWRLRAERGRLGAEGDHLALAGSVQATEVSVLDPLRFTAPSVDILLDARRLHSDARVTVWQDAHEMQGTGMRADLRAGTMTLLKDVTSRYVH